MKLRQKLAVVMAAAMVVTAVPVVTVAATSNSLSLGSVSMIKGGAVGFTVEKNKNDNGVTTSTTYTTAATAPLTLNLESKREEADIDQSFFVTIDNAEFQLEAYHAYANGGSVTVNNKGEIVVEETTRTTPEKITSANSVVTIAPEDSDYTMKVTVTDKKELKVDVQGTVAKGETLHVPIFAVATSNEEVTLTVDGTDTFVSSTKEILGTATTKSATATVVEKLNISEEGGKIGSIVLTEAAKGVFANTENTEIEIKLATSSDLEFATKQNVTVKGNRGFAGVKAEGYATTISEDGLTLTIDIADLQDALARQTASGQLVIEGIEVVPANKTASLGEVEVTVKNKNLETTKLTVAEVVAEDVTLKCETPAELVAGKEAQAVKFTFKESTKEAIIDGRKVEFTIENGFIDVRHTQTVEEKVSYLSAMETFERLVNSGDIVLPTQVKLEDIVAVEANAEGQITGFTVEFNNLTANTASSLTFTMPIMADINTTGDVTLKAEGRAIQGTKEEKIATVAAPYTVTAETAELKVGLNGQVAGKLTIAETAPEMLEKGTVTIQMDEYTGISFKKGQALDIKAENITIKNVKVATNAITFDVTRTSEEKAGNIVIDGIEFNVDRTAPEGSFDLAIYGQPVSKNVYMKSGLEKLVVSDFVVIGTKNTEDITASNGLKAGTASFKIDSTTYTVNGVEKTMDGAPYLSNGRTMVPVRYVSEAFGIDGDKVVFNKGVVTLFAGNRIVQLTNGSNIAVVNGVSIPMDEAVVIKEGRTYIPVGEVGRLLGVNVSWSNETKTATFTN